MQELTMRISAADDNGNKYEILVYTEIIEIRTRGGTHRRHGLSELFTDDGRRVNMLDDETFQIVDTGQRLRKI